MITKARASPAKAAKQRRLLHPHIDLDLELDLDPLSTSIDWLCSMYTIHCL